MAVVMAVVVKCVAVADFGADVVAVAADVAMFFVILFMVAVAVFSSAFLLFSSLLFPFTPSLSISPPSSSLLLTLSVPPPWCVWVPVFFYLVFFLAYFFFRSLSVHHSLFLPCSSYAYIFMFVTTYLRYCGLLVLLLA